MTAHDWHDVGDVTLHVAVEGDGPPVVLCHGFPQLWYAWRHVLPLLAAGGYSAVAPDLRGYGESSVPTAADAYRQRLICADLIGILDALGHRRAVFVGHDMGGSVVWHLAACHPERVRAVCAIGTPYAPPGRSPLTELWRRHPGVFDYQLYLQEPGAAENELEADVERALTLLVRAPDEGVCALDRYSDVCARGGLLAGLSDAPRSRLLTEADLAFYVAAFRRTGFAGALHWYRNYHDTWEWLLDHARHPITQPAMLVSPGRDPVLTEDLSAGLERVVPGLVRARLPDCGHYVPEEQPAALAGVLLPWLDGLPA
jgi:soluble epoxide hydrolase/lipid-phosphate phosphatase